MHASISFFIYFWLRWVFVAARGLSLVVVSRGYSSLRCTGFSCCGARALGMRASAVVARGLSSCGSRALERRLSSCGARAQLLCGMWDLPRPGLEPVSPALTGGFPTTVPPGKPQGFLIIFIHWTVDCFGGSIVFHLCIPQGRTMSRTLVGVQ